MSIFGCVEKRVNVLGLNWVNIRRKLKFWGGGVRPWPPSNKIAPPQLITWVNGEYNIIECKLIDSSFFGQVAFLYVILTSRLKSFQYVISTTSSIKARDISKIYSLPTERQSLTHEVEEELWAGPYSSWVWRALMM